MCFLHKLGWTYIYYQKMHLHLTHQDLEPNHNNDICHIAGQPLGHSTTVRTHPDGNKQHGEHLLQIEIQIIKKDLKRLLFKLTSTFFNDLDINIILAS